MVAFQVSGNGSCQAHLAIGDGQLLGLATGCLALSCSGASTGDVFFVMERRRGSRRPLAGRCPEQAFRSAVDPSVFIGLEKIEWPTSGFGWAQSLTQLANDSILRR